MGAKSPLEAVERLTAVPLDTLAPLSPDEEARLRDEVRAEARAAVDELKAPRRAAQRAQGQSCRWRRRRTST